MANYDFNKFSNIDDKNVDVESAEVNTVSESTLVDMKIEMQKLYNYLQSDKFDHNKFKEELKKYLDNYNRILYSEISAAIFKESESNIFNIINNLESIAESSASNIFLNQQVEEVDKSILKLWDHVNLANMQLENLQMKDKTLREKFNTVVQPVVSELREETQNSINSNNRDLTNSLLAMLGIFTALAFLLFGGVSSASSVLSNISSIQLPLLMVLMSIWGGIICNISYFLIYFVSKLIHISIKTNNRYNASVFRRHPYICLINFALLSMFVLSSWFYFIEVTTGDKWIKLFILNNKDFLLIGTFIVFFLLLLAFSYLLFKINDSKHDW